MVTSPNDNNANKLIVKFQGAKWIAQFLEIH